MRDIDTQRACAPDIGARTLPDAFPLRGVIDPLHRSPSLTPASLRETGALVHDHDSPLTSIFRGTASDGTDVAIQMIASHLVALAPNVSRVVAQLQRLQDLDAGPQGRVVWAELLADGRIGVARRWLDSDPVVSVVRSSGKSPRQLTLAASVFSRELAEWHAQDLLHGAIAPTGLRMERNTGRLFAEDLGIMAALVSGGARSLQIIAGTQALAYASPELTESGIVDRRTDIYALGTTLFELLTGSPPFGGRTTAAIMASVLIPGTDEVANIDEATGASALVSALLRAIEKAPDDRWTTADQFADALLEETLRPSSLTDLREGDTRAHVPGILSRLALIALTARNRFTGRS